MTTPPRILYLEDDPDDVELLRRALAGEGLECDVVALESREAFVAALEADPPDLILSDGSLPGIDGPAALTLAKERLPHVPVFLVSGTCDEAMIAACRQLGAAGFLAKDDRPAIVRAVRLALTPPASARDDGRQGGA